MVADVQPLEDSSSSVPITGKEPVTYIPLDEENNEINNGNETVHIPPPPSNDAESGIS